MKRIVNLPVVNEPLGMFYACQEIAQEALQSSGGVKGRTDNSPAKTLLLRMIDLLDGEHEEDYFEALSQFLDLHSETISEVSSSGEEGGR